MSKKNHKLNNIRGDNMAQSPKVKKSLETGKDGALYLVATPIGNLGDISARALETLKNCDILLAEDTRMGKKLLSAFGLNNKIIRADEEASDYAAQIAIETLATGQNVALISDAGTPCVSDPGQRIAAKVIEAGFEIFPIPGASSVLSALVASGLEAKQFAFLGFIPNKTGQRREFLESYKALKLTLIMFETAPRLVASLADMAQIFGARKAVVTRELTKLYEEKKRGTLLELAQFYQENGPPKGEIVIVIEGQSESEAQISDEEIEKLLLEALKSHSVKDASSMIAKNTGRKARDLYEMALKIRKNEE